MYSAQNMAPYGFQGLINRMLMWQHIHIYAYTLNKDKCIFIQITYTVTGVKFLNVTHDLRFQQNMSFILKNQYECHFHMIYL